MRKKKEITAKSIRQAKNLVFLVIAFAVLIIILTFVRYPKTYVGAFIGNYSGTEDVISNMKGEAVNNTDDSKKLLPYQQDYDDWKEQNLATEVSVSAEDGSTLKGKLYDHGSKVTVVYLHTLGSSSEGDFLYAPWYWEKGYNILMPDNRGHGDSDGSCATYGLKESGDVNQWLSLLCKTYGSDSKIIVQGDTLGAADALMASAKYPEQVAFTVAESPIDNLYDAGEYLVKQQFTSLPFFIQLADRYNYQQNDFRLEDVVTSKAVAQSSTPLLMLCGSDDTIVDPSNAVSIQKAAESANEACEVISVDHAGHGMLYATDSQKIQKEIDTYIEKYIG